VKTCLPLTFAGLLLVSGLVPGVAAPAAEPYDETADGAALVARALDRARHEKQRVLLVFGANWCSDCRAMDALLSSHPAIAAELKAHYVVAKIDVGRDEQPRKNAELIRRFGAAVESGIPLLLVVNEAGRALHDSRKERLADSDHREPAKVLAYLRKWAP